MLLLKKVITTWFSLVWTVHTIYDLYTLPYRDSDVQKNIAANHPNCRVRRKAFELLGAEIGDGTHINQGVRIVNDHPEKKMLRIGKNVGIAPGVILVCNSGPAVTSILYEYPEFTARLVKAAPIVIEDDAWIGAGTIFLPGVTIGKGAVIGAGAVVVSSIPAYMIATGVPAKPVRDARDPSTTRGRQGS